MKRIHLCQPPLHLSHPLLFHWPPSPPPLYPPIQCRITLYSFSRCFLSSARTRGTRWAYSIQMWINTRPCICMGIWVYRNFHTMYLWLAKYMYYTYNSGTTQLHRVRTLLADAWSIYHWSAIDWSLYYSIHSQGISTHSINSPWGLIIISLPLTIETEVYCCRYYIIFKATSIALLTTLRPFVVVRAQNFSLFSSDDDATEIIVYGWNNYMLYWLYYIFLCVFLF